MVSSFRDNLYRRPNLANTGTEIPERFIRRRPAWTNNPAIVPPANPNDPYGDPPHFHELDPPERNPYNDPDYSPFIVTRNLSGQSGDKPVGGLLGMLLAMMQQSQVQPGADSVSAPDGAPEYNSDSDGSPQGLLGRQLALQDEQTPKGFDSNPQDAPQQALPERRLGRRTYRV